MEKLISIIVPVYNSEKVIKKCVDSILNQTYSNLEIILVNDGSIDNSPKICDEIAIIDKRVKVIHQKNKGASAARNAGLLASSGDYIGFVDCDDYIENTMYEKLIKRAINSKSNIVMCDYYIVCEDNMPVVLCHDGHINKKSGSEVLKDVFQGKYMGALWNKLFSRSVLMRSDELLLFDEELHFCEDVFFLTKILKDQTIFIEPVPLYYYVIYETSLSHGEINKRKLTIVHAMDMIVNEIDDNYPDLVKDANFFAAHVKLSTRELVYSTDRINRALARKLLKSANHNIRRVSFSKRFKLWVHAYFPRLSIRILNLKRKLRGF